MIEGHKIMCDVGEESKSFSWCQKTKAGQASEQTGRNITAIKLMEILAVGCYYDWKTHRRKIFDSI